VLAAVHDAVPVGWPAAEEPALHDRLGTHGGPHPDPDAGTFAFAHPAEDRHHQVVRFAVRVDRATDLRHPELDAVVDEQRERQPVLVAVEGALRLADHHGVEAAVGVLERREQKGGCRPAFPRQRTG